MPVCYGPLVKDVRYYRKILNDAKSILREFAACHCEAWASGDVSLLRNSNELRENVLVEIDRIRGMEEEWPQQLADSARDTEREMSNSLATYPQLPVDDSGPPITPLPNQLENAENFPPPPTQSRSNNIVRRNRK